MGFIQFNEKLVSRPNLPLNSFETKAVGFCKRAADVVVVQLSSSINFSLQENRMTVKLSNG